MEITGRVLGYRAVQVNEFIRAYVTELGYGPSYDEIRISVGISTKGEVHKIVKRLERRGLVEIDTEQSGRGHRRLKLPKAA